MAFTISSPDATVLGETIAEWTEDWWTWALQAPAHGKNLKGNPLTDTTGKFANVNNDGKVFFIAGDLGGTVDRTFDVPFGKSLLVPLLNDVAISFNTDPEPQKATDNKLLSDWTQSVNVNSLFATIDGGPNLQSYYEKTDFFSPGQAQPGSLLAAIGAPAGDDLYPTRAAGYYLMINDLSLGEHTLHFGGTTSTGMSVNVTDHINVVKPPMG